MVRQFVDERDWSQFHTPRNLLLALVGEIGELAAEFQWVNDRDVRTHLDSEEKQAQVEQEIADVFIYLLLLCDELGMSLSDATKRKIVINRNKYPIETSFSSAKKYQIETD